MPDTKHASKAYFGAYGGQYVPETLMPALEEFERAFNKYQNDPDFKKELDFYLREYVGRPSPLYLAQRLSASLPNNPRVYLKREDLNHTGAHKINNAIAQALIAKRLGKHYIVAETGAGQHGVATATACALLGLKAKVFMGELDMARQAPNVARMRLLGAEVIGVKSGTRTLKDATSEAIRYWVTNVETTHYIIGSAVGPHPYPTIVREFQKIIGEESREQILKHEGRLPDYVLACIGGGSNAIGMFYPFLANAKNSSQNTNFGSVPNTAAGQVTLIGVEAAGEGIETNRHAASLAKGSPGVLHGSKSYLLQDAYGQIQEAHSISAGLDYPGIGPEHSYLRDAGLAKYVSVTDTEAVSAFKQLCKLEGIIPALESSHALAYLPKLLEIDNRPNLLIALCLSGRGDKDLDQILKA